MYARAAFLTVALLSISGCDSSLDLDGKSDVALCVDAHNTYMAAKTVADEKQAEIYAKNMADDPKWKSDPLAYPELESLRAQEAKAKTAADFHLLCLRAAAGK